MTFSILAIDPDSETIGGAAATGSLCVGGWVLRGDARSGMSASQGASPSTFWGEDVLDLMRGGMSAVEAVAQVTGDDSGRRYRQIAALDLSGRVASFTGDRNSTPRGSKQFINGIVSGNTLGSEDVLAAMQSCFQETSGSLAKRLITALYAGEEAGGDDRGIQSAALLVVGMHQSPLTVRIDFDENPISKLNDVYRRTQKGDYARWARQVPTPIEPERTID